MNNQEKLEIVKRHIAQLMEHFNSVQVIAVSRPEQDGGTCCHSSGDGSWYERFGAVSEVLVTMRKFAHQASEERDREDDE